MSLISVLVAGRLPVVLWQWGFCRFYVGPDQMAVITAKTGEALPPGQILAKKGQKGIQEDVLGEGRHFLNPISVRTRDPCRWSMIPPGKVGMVTSKVGEELPEGEFLAERGQKGIWRGAGAGQVPPEPVGYQIDIVDAISIPIGYAGVVTSLSGEQAPAGEFAGPDQKGVRKRYAPAGLYYVNPREYKVDVLEIGVNQVSLLGKGGGAVITKGLIDVPERGDGGAAEQRAAGAAGEARRLHASERRCSGMRLGRQPAPTQPRGTLQAAHAGAAGQATWSRSSRNTCSATAWPRWVC